MACLNIHRSGVLTDDGADVQTVTDNSPMRTTVATFSITDDDGGNDDDRGCGGGGGGGDDDDDDDNDNGDDYDGDDDTDDVQRVAENARVGMAVAIFPMMTMMMMLRR